MITIRGLAVADRHEAWKLVTLLTRHEFVYDSFRSERAGYPVFYDTDIDSKAYVCDIGDRLEINYTDGKSQNIWFRFEDI